MMTMTRRAVAVAVAALALPLGLAAPASAAEIVADPCSDVQYQVGAGTTVRFTFVNPCQLREYGGADPDSPNANAPTPTFTGMANTRGNTGDLWVTVTSADQLAIIKSRIRDGGAYRQVVFGCDFSYTGNGLLMVLGCDAPPPPVLQSVPLPDSGTCDSVKDADLSWGTTVTGGWSKSWDQWPNGGRGGFVCVRTFEYSQSLGGWTLQD